MDRPRLLFRLSGALPGPSWGSLGAFAVVIGPLAFPGAAALQIERGGSGVEGGGAPRGSGSGDSGVLLPGAVVLE